MMFLDRLCVGRFDEPPVRRLLIHRMPLALAVSKVSPAGFPDNLCQSPDMGFAQWN